jgi:hypothetical protein
MVLAGRFILTTISSGQLRRAVSYSLHIHRTTLHAHEFDARLFVLDGSITLVFGDDRCTDAPMVRAIPATSRPGPCTKSARKQTACDIWLGGAWHRMRAPLNNIRRTRSGFGWGWAWRSRHQYRRTRRVDSRFDGCRDQHDLWSVRHDYCYTIPGRSTVEGHAISYAEREEL